jgi:hypothetical protein
MRIKNLRLSTLWKGIFAGLCFAAIVVDLGFFAGRADWYILNYYTLLSNIACFVFFAMANTASEKALKRGERDFAWHPRVEGMFVFCIAVTGIIYATMLAQEDIAEGKFLTFHNLVLHYIGPSMVVLDWLLFSPKGRFRPADPLLWLLAPLGYFGYILVRSTFAGPIGDTGSRFPYGFIDPAVKGGWGEMFWGVAFIAIGMAALGYIIYTLDWLLARRGGR